MFWGIVGLIFVVWLFSNSASSKKAKPKKHTNVRDNSQVYWSLKERAEQIRRDLENMVWEHSEDKSYWERILNKYNAWLVQEEEAAKVPCIENDHSASYMESTTLFSILAHLGRHEEAEDYIRRLSQLGHHNPIARWKESLQYVEKEKQAELEHQSWLETVPEQVSTLLDTGRSAQLRKLTTLCISRDEPEAAQKAFEALQSLGDTPEDQMLVLHAGISRLVKNYAVAIEDLQSAYPVALANGVKSKINKIEVEMRKVLADQGVSDPATNANKLLSAKL